MFMTRAVPATAYPRPSSHEWTEPGRRADEVQVEEQGPVPLHRDRDAVGGAVKGMSRRSVRSGAFTGLILAQSAAGRPPRSREAAWPIRSRGR